MNIDEFVLDVATGPNNVPLAGLLRVASEYVDMLAEAGLPPISDPAVLLLGAFISFQTHSDINTVGGYRRLLNACEERQRCRLEDLENSQ